MLEKGIMKILIEPFAEASLQEIAFFIESKNTSGSVLSENALLFMK